MPEQFSAVRSVRRRILVANDGQTRPPVWPEDSLMRRAPPARWARYLEKCCVVQAAPVLGELDRVTRDATIGLSQEGRTLRLAAGLPEASHSSVWRMWTSAKGDLYIAPPVSRRTY
jgi:hypothetical protein